MLSAKFRELADPAVVAGLLRRFCALLRIPVFVQDDDEPINHHLVPWRLEPDVPDVRRRRVEMDFARSFESVFDPLVCLPLPSGGSAQGLLWLQDGATYATSDNRNVSVYVRGMLVSDDARDLMPRWAGFASAVIENDKLAPTASREDLQKDDAFDETAALVRDTLIEGLRDVARHAPTTWRTILLRHNEALLGAALSDDRLYGLLRDDLKVPTSEGDLTLPVIAQRSGGKLHVSMATRGSPEETVFRALGVPVIEGNRYGALPFSQAYADQNNLTVVQMGTEVGNQTLFPTAELPAAQHERLSRALLGPNQELVPSRFRPAELPLVLIPDRAVELKERMEADEADRRISRGALSLARLYTKTIDDTIRARLYLNLDSPVVQRLASDDSPAHGAGAAMLKALAAVLASHRDTATESDLSGALREVTQALETLLDLAKGER
ncbi:MAG: hypothetical protein AAFN74_10925 [Myxococcota bacterium]